MGKHTPGPWGFSENTASTPEQPCINVDTCGRDYIPSIAYIQAHAEYGYPPSEAFANARLIAAAPELLAEMKRYLPILEQCERGTRWATYTEGAGIATLNGYRAAIAKAEGTDNG